MADSGIAVVAPMPSEQQPPMNQDEMATVTTDSKVLTHKIVASTTLTPLPTTLPQTHDEHAITDPDDSINHDNEEPGGTGASETAVRSEDAKSEPASDDTIILSDESFLSGCSSSKHDPPEKQMNGGSDPKATTTGQPVKKKRKIDETIIDGFVISAFKSWEELQDEMNERIASNLIKQRVSKEEVAGDEVVAKKKKKNKTKSPSNELQPGSTRNDSQSLLQQPEIISANKIKKDSNSSRKSSNGQCSKTVESNSCSKKRVDGERKHSAREVNSLSSQGSVERGSSHQHKKPKGDPTSASKGNRNHEIPSQSAENNNNVSPHTSRSPQVHHTRDQLDKTIGEPTQLRTQQPTTPQRILAQDLLRDPHTTSHPQSAQYSPYGNNPHLNQLYNITSNIQHSMQNPPFDQLHRSHQPGPKLSPGQSKVPMQHSQAPQHMQKPSVPAPTPAQQSQSAHISQQHQAYPQGPTPSMPYQGHPSMASMNQSHPFYHHPMHMPGANPYLYQQQQANVSHYHPPLPPHINPQTQSTPQNPYAQPAAPQNHHHQYPGYIPHPGAHNQSPMPPPLGMHPHHMPPQQPQTSSIMTSMSMSQLPNPYGAPYIVNETTISRQTSIIPPPMPSALEQAAASAATSRFGHHPMLPSIGLFNPAQAQQSNPASMYQPPTGAAPPTLSNAERSFLDLARSYNAASAAARAIPSNQLASYSNPMNSPASFPPPPTSTGSPFALDRWPTKMAIEHHHRTISGYNSLYQNPGASSGYSTRPATFPAGLFPPPF